MLSIPIGLYATARSGKLDERITSTLLYMLYSLPAFVAALFLQMLFAIKLRGTPFELPLFGMTSDNFDQLSPAGQVWDLFKHALLPIVCYTYGSLAYYSRFIHANMQEVIRQDYIRTARAKGVPPVPRALAPRLSQHADSAGDADRPDAARPAERLDHPRADFQLARHGEAVLRIDPRARLPDADGPDADVLRADAAGPDAGRLPVRGGRSARDVQIGPSSGPPIACVFANARHSTTITELPRQAPSRPRASGAKPGGTSAGSRLSMLALAFVVLMALVALFSPAIAGTKPIVCKYKGHIYFPALGYFNMRWENPDLSHATASATSIRRT